MLGKEKLDRINYLARKAKSEGLTNLEKQEQKKDLILIIMTWILILE